jgi:hypothetical protein
MIWPRKGGEPTSRTSEKNDRQTGQAASTAAAIGQTQTERPIRAADEEVGLEVSVPTT